MWTVLICMWMHLQTQGYYPFWTLPCGWPCVWALPAKKQFTRRHVIIQPATPAQHGQSTLNLRPCGWLQCPHFLTSFLDIKTFLQQLFYDTFQPHCRGWSWFCGPTPPGFAPFSATACEMKVNAAKAKSKADVITAAYGALWFDLLQAWHDNANGRLGCAPHKKRHGL